MKSIFLAPAPRRVADILDNNDLLRLRALGEVVIHEDGPLTDELFEDQAPKAEIIIGQVDLPESRLKRALCRARDRWPCRVPPRPRAQRIPDGPSTSPLSVTGAKAGARTCPPSLIRRR